MAERIPQSATIRVPLQAYLSSDHISPATGKTIAITLSQNGGAYANPSGGATNAVEIGNGSYYVDLTTTDTGTLGPLFVLGTASGVDNVVAIYNVVKATNAGFTGVPDANAGAANGLWILGANAAATTTLTGVAAAGATPATAALALTGGVASTTGGGTAAAGLAVTGGNGAASGNGAAAGATFAGGGVTTVSGADGVTMTGTGNGNGLHGLGAGSGDGAFFIGGATGNGLHGKGGATSGDGSRLEGFGGGNGLSVVRVGGSNHDINCSGDGVIQGTVGIDWNRISNPTTTVDLSGTTIKNLDNNPPGTLTAAQIATGVWQDTTAGDFTVSASIGKSIMNGVALGTGLTVNDLSHINAIATTSVTAISANLGTTQPINFTGTGASALVKSDTIDWNSVAVGGMPNSTTPPTTAAIATAVWQDTTAGDFTVALSIGKSIMNGVSLGTGLTINTVTNAVTLPANPPAGFLVTASYGTAPGWYTAPTNLTAAQIATGVWQDATAGDFTTAGSIGKSLFTSGNAPGTASGLLISTQLPANFSSLGISAGGHISTIDAYTGDTPQTGDSFARIGTTGSGLTSLAPSATALSTATWTGARAGYLDNLNIGGAVSSHADIVALGSPMQAGTQVTLASTGLNNVLVAGITLPNAIKYIGAICAGTLPAGAGSGQENWKDFSGAAAVDITVDVNGNRTAIVYH